MTKDERIKYRPLTVRELEYQLKRVVEQKPNAPVQIGVCICGTRVITFEKEPTINCPKCEAETSVKPLTVRVK